MITAFEQNAYSADVKENRKNPNVESNEIFRKLHLLCGKQF